MDSPGPSARCRPRAFRQRAASLGLLLLGLLPAIAGGSARSTPDGRVLVAVADEWCPYTCAADAQQQGYIVDLVRAVFEPLGYRIEYRVMPWPRALRETQLGRANLALGITPADARELVMPTLMADRCESSFAVPPDSEWRYRGIADLEGVTLGVTAGYSYFGELDEWIARHRDDPARIDVGTGESPLDASLRKLREGRIDVFIENRNVLKHAAAKLPADQGFRLQGQTPGQPIVVGFSPASPQDVALAAVFDTRIRQLRESGELAAILAAYGMDDASAGRAP